MKTPAVMQGTDNPAAGLRARFESAFAWLRADEPEPRVAVLAICAFALGLAAMLVAVPRTPPDDLLRHLVAWRVGYDYKQLYVHTWLPDFDPWIGFDWLAGVAERAWPGRGFVPMQILALAAVTWSWLRASRGALPGLRVTAFVVLLIALGYRVVMARPSLLLSCVFLGLWFAAERRKWLQVALATLLAPMYWLWFIYVIPLVMRDRRFLLALAGGLAFWLTYAGAAYPATLLRLVQGLHDRQQPVSEAKTILLVFLWGYALIPLALYFARDRRTALATGWFALANQIRYRENVIPLALSFVRFARRDVPRLVPLLLAPVVLSSFTGRVVLDGRGLGLEGHKVLCTFSSAVYDLTYTVPGVRVAPAMEIGWAEPATQTLITGMPQHGRLDTREVARQGFDFVAEDSLREIPPGLVLHAVRGGWRIWRVPPELAAAAAH